MEGSPWTWQLLVESTWSATPTARTKDVQNTSMLHRVRNEPRAHLLFMEGNDVAYYRCSKTFASENKLFASEIKLC